MAIGVYLNFNGNCLEAVEFYAETFGLEKPKIMTFGDVPSDPSFPLTDDVKKMVMNTSLTINGSTIMFSDTPPYMPFTLGNNISLVFNSSNLDEIKHVFNKLKDGGSVTMELQETFWSKCYGFLVDKFGVGWQLNYDNGNAT